MLQVWFYVYIYNCDIIFDHLVVKNSNHILLLGDMQNCRRSVCCVLVILPWFDFRKICTWWALWQLSRLLRNVGDGILTRVPWANAPLNGATTLTEKKLTRTVGTDKMTRMHIITMCFNDLFCKNFPWEEVQESK